MRGDKKIVPAPRDAIRLETPPAATAAAATAVAPPDAAAAVAAADIAW